MQKKVNRRRGVMAAHVRQATASIPSAQANEKKMGEPSERTPTLVSKGATS